MRILIVGPGAIGRCLAAHLAAAGVDTALLDHDPLRARRIATRGIRVVDPGGGTLVEAKVRALTPGQAEPIHDLVASCVKSYQTEAALQSALPSLHPDGVLLLLSNGLGNLAVARRKWRSDRCLGGTVSCGAERRGDTDACLTGRGPLRLGAAAKDRVLRRIGVSFTRLLGRAGLEAEWVEDLRRVLWEKAAINCGINAVAALLGVTNGDLIDSPVLPLCAAASREAAAVARREGVALAAAGWRRRLVEVCRWTARNRCSMLTDLLAKRRTEIEALCGEVWSRGEKNGVSTPVNQALTLLIRARESLNRG